MNLRLITDIVTLFINGIIFVLGIEVLFFLLIDFLEFTANFAVFESLSPALITFLITFVLQVTDYDGSSTTGQLPSAIIGIRIIASILPMIGLVICMILLKFYPLQGQPYDDMRKKFNELQESSAKIEDNIEIEII